MLSDLFGGARFKTLTPSNSDDVAAYRDFTATATKYSIGNNIYFQ